MGNSSLFPKLAFQSIRNNRKFYLPYILALIGNVAAVYIMSALVSDPGVKDIAPGRPNAHMYVEAFMSIGMVIATSPWCWCTRPCTWARRASWADWPRGWSSTSW